MKRKIIVIVTLFFITFSVYALTTKFNFSLETLSFNKSNTIMTNFNKDYTLTYKITDLDKELEEEITSLTKKTTYLLLGEIGTGAETSEEYYNRHEDFLNLVYLPDIPKDSKTSSGYDENSKEYKDYLVSSMTLPKVFLSLSEYGVIYNSYGDIQITKSSDLIISTIVLPNIKIKQTSSDNPSEYEYISSNLILHYYFKELKNDYKLYYLYTELEDDLDLYFDNVASVEKLNTLAIIPPYENNSDIYDYSKLNNLSNEVINKIYNTNKQNIVYLTANYNNSVVKTANGIIIDDGLVVTTWDFLEDALINAQEIMLTSNGETLIVQGIVTINPNIDLVVLKLTNKTNTYVKLGDTTNLKLYDASVSLATTLGVGVTSNAGIIIANANYLETSIPISKDISGSSLFNQNGELIGLKKGENTNTSMSRFIKSEALKEIQDKFKNLKFEDIDTISFQDLKAKYYYLNYNEEIIKNNIPARKWKEYSKIGNIENNINLELVKASYKNGIISLRYKNSIKNYANSRDLIANYLTELENSGFKNTLNTDKKIIYKNKKYQIIIMEEFDYLIIVEVKL